MSALAGAKKAPAIGSINFFELLQIAPKRLKKPIQFTNLEISGFSQLFW